MNVTKLHQESHELTKSEMKSTFKKHFFRYRRAIKQMAHASEVEHANARCCRHKANKLKIDGNPFNATRIAALTSHADVLVSRCRERTSLSKDIAIVLLDGFPFLDLVTTLSERCNWLNVNVADRAGLSEEDGFVNLIYLHGLEDSAEHRDEDFKDGPLFRAVMLIMVDFLCNTPEGKKVGDSLWEPGGLFESVPKYQKNSDGELVRLPPNLRVIK